MEKPGGETVLGWVGIRSRVRWSTVRDKTSEPVDHELCAKDSFKGEPEEDLGI